MEHATPVKLLSMLATDGVLAELEVGGSRKELRFEQLVPYWDYANQDDFEGGRLSAVDGLIIGFGGQGGIAFIWDPVKEAVLHISEAAYAVAVTMDEKYVYIR